MFPNLNDRLDSWRKRAFTSTLLQNRNGNRFLTNSSSSSRPTTHLKSQKKNIQESWEPLSFMDMISPRESKDGPPAFIGSKKVLPCPAISCQNTGSTVRWRNAEEVQPDQGVLVLCLFRRKLGDSIGNLQEYALLSYWPAKEECCWSDDCGEVKDEILVEYWQPLTKPKLE